MDSKGDSETSGHAERESYAQKELSCETQEIARKVAVVERDLNQIKLTASDIVTIESDPTLSLPEPSPEPSAMQHNGRGAIATRPQVFPMDDTLHDRAALGWYGQVSSSQQGSQLELPRCSILASKKALMIKLLIIVLIATLLIIVVVIVTVSLRNKGHTGNQPAGGSNHSLAPPSGPCTDLQIEHGCAPGFCTGPEQCWCRPNYDRLPSGQCAIPLGAHRMQFYMYRVESDSSDTTQGDIANSVVDSLAGVMWTLHNRIVTRSCPRNFRITRIVRFKAIVFNTDMPFAYWRGQFGPFVNFSDGECLHDESCTSLYEKFGSVVGCTAWAPFVGGSSYGNTTQWYSLPGATKKSITASALRQLAAAGGECMKPDGASSCTWTVEPAGEVSVDELEGISDYGKFCASGNKEYDEKEDRGKGCTFWDGRGNSTASTARMGRLQHLFMEKYPNSSLPEPTCDSESAQCKYHEHCLGLSGSCCPASNGEMLECCSRRMR